MPKLRAALAAVAVLVLGLTACTPADEEPGAAESPDTSTEAPSPESETGETGTEAPAATDPATDGVSTESAAAPTESPTDAAADDTLLDVITSQGEFALLEQALAASGLDEQLADVGPYTVFAPNDDAFASVDQVTLTQLLADPSQIRTILAGHIVEGAVTSAELTDGTTLQTIEGGTLDVTVSGDTVMVGDATIVRADLQAANGVVHVIDDIIVP